MSPGGFVASRIIVNAPADGGGMTKTITVPVHASSGYPPPTSQ
jgi:hypothetical protein